MRFISLFLALAASTAVKSYIVDPNLEDGVYFIPTIDSAKTRSNTQAYGQPVRIGDVVSTRSDTAPRGVIGKVSVEADSNQCYGATENRWDHEGALNSMKKRCNSGEKVPEWRNNKSGIILARYGSSVSFVCS
ncbi:hypothetical protein F4779DRAFT_617105 [Xylariaceae sp. FL0662B]|nr:hypothetical protein F4779DRAFT_617105 [Xylariaceae sp. FL0662B]